MRPPVIFFPGRFRCSDARGMIGVLCASAAYRVQLHVSHHPRPHTNRCYSTPICRVKPEKFLKNVSELRRDMRSSLQEDGNGANLHQAARGEIAPGAREIAEMCDLPLLGR
jgi:hypothetical protein